MATGDIATELFINAYTVQGFWWILEQAVEWLRDVAVCRGGGTDRVGPMQRRGPSSSNREFSPCTHRAAGGRSLPVQAHRQTCGWGRS